MPPRRLAKPSKTVAGRIPDWLLLESHLLCRKLGIETTSHWQAVRILLEIAVRSWNPEASMDWDSTRAIALETMSHSRGLTYITESTVATMLQAANASSGEAPEPAIVITPDYEDAPPEATMFAQTKASLGAIIDRMIPPLTDEEALENVEQVATDGLFGKRK